MKMISSDSISDLASSEDQIIAGQIQKGRTKAITWLGINRKSSGRVAAYLQQQGFNGTVLDQILSSLKDDGYLDDNRLARYLVSQRQGRYAESRAALGQRLQRLGLDSTSIESALPAASDDLQAANELVETRFRRQFADVADMAAEDDPAARERALFLLQQKVGRFLAGRGFSMATIVSVLRKNGKGIDTFD
jgi:SOS response regulatory protein OraA/RecX